MKLAILLLCHKNAEQINLFLQTMKHPDIDFISTWIRNHISLARLKRDLTYIYCRIPCA